MLRTTSEERSMTKKALAISLTILACLFLAALPVVAEDSPESSPGFFQDLYQAILEWIVLPDDADDLVSPPPSPPATSTMNTPPQPEIGGYIPPGG